MRNRPLLHSVIIAALAGPVAISGCASHRTYNPYYEWDGPQLVLYERWEVETHRPHRDYWNRGAEEQREYWYWRKHHRDRDRDHDRDHDRD
jgi:hypothetical protein